MTAVRSTASAPLPFAPLAPLLVLLLGVLSATLLAHQGTTALEAQGRSAALLRARVLGAALAARLAGTSREHFAPLLERAARRSGAELLLIDPGGRVLVDVSLTAPPPAQLRALLARPEGDAETRLGATQYTVTALPAPHAELRLATFVRPPGTPFASSSLIGSIGALTLMLLGTAVLAALSITRDVKRDLAFATERITALASSEGTPDASALPLRGIDQVAVLTAALGVLVDRFGAAEQAYRADLARALASDRQRSAFLAALSHELRTPLNSILGFTDVLLAEVDGPLSEEARENLEVIRSSGQHLRGLIADVLDLTALESGELHLTCHLANVAEVVADVVREQELAARDKLVTLRLETEPAMAEVDLRRVRQIASNLIGNALKFTQHGEVRVRVLREEEEVLLIVEDTGPGIAAAELRAIFQVFRQSGDASSRHVGTGLGLAITHRLVQMHGGKIDLKSDLGKGARFTVRFPIQAAKFVDTLGYGRSVLRQVGTSTR